jgi:hypothetical protein
VERVNKLERLEFRRVSARAHYLAQHRGTFGDCRKPECVEARAVLEQRSLFEARPFTETVDVETRVL